MQEEFQFLYGAIKTLITSSDPKVRDMFQFLYGAIKTLITLLTSSMIILSFNSSMVRLKPGAQGYDLWAQS